MWTVRFGVVVLVAGVLGVSGRAQSPVPQATLHVVGDLTGGGYSSGVRDAVKVNGTIYAVGGGTAVLAANSSDTGFLWTWDGSTAQLTALPNLVTAGTVQVNAGALTPDAAYIASQVRAGGAAAVRVAMSSVPLGNTNPHLAVSNDPNGTFRLYDGLAAPLSNRPHAAVAISDSGSVLYGGVQGLTRAARFDINTLSTTLVPLIPGKAMNLPAARGSSGDGNVMVGTATTTAASLSSRYPFQYAHVSLLSQHTAFRYEHGSPAGTSTAIPGPTGNGWSVALDVSANGQHTLVAGNSTAFPRGELYIHDAGTGTLTELGSPNAAWVPTSFGGMTDDGSVVGVTLSADGFVTLGSRHAYFRNAQGWFHVASALYDAGVDIAQGGWYDLQILGMSPDATLVFGYGWRNMVVGTTTQAVTEAIVIEFDPGYLAAYDPPAQAPADTSIVGAWTDDLNNPSAVMTLMADGSYYVIGASGLERGLYRYDGNTVRAVTLQDFNGDDGISDANEAPATVSLNGDELRSPSGCTIEPECQVFTRIQGGAGTIVGGWLTGDATQPDASSVVVLLANGRFFHAQDGAASGVGRDGVEIGDYFWNPVTGDFGAQAPLVLDTNGEWGFSHPSSQEQLGLTADELQLVSIGGGTFGALRIVDPATVLPAITSSPTAAGIATTPFSYTITGTRALTFSAPDAPAWMSVNAGTGVLSGTPPAAGLVNVTIVATNSFGDTGEATLVITVDSPTPSILRTGFYEPVSQTPGFVNVVKGGSTVPLKFNVYVDGVEQTSTTGLSFGVWAVACSDAVAEDPIDFTTTGGTELRYDADEGQFVQNWKTPTTPGCYLVRMTTIADGLSIAALFMVK